MCQGKLLACSWVSEPPGWAGRALSRARPAPLVSSIRRVADRALISSRDFLLPHRGPWRLWRRKVIRDLGKVVECLMVGEQISEKAGVCGTNEQEIEEEESSPHGKGHKCRPMRTATFSHRTG